VAREKYLKLYCLLIRRTGNAVLRPAGSAFDLRPLEARGRLRAPAGEKTR